MNRKQFSVFLQILAILWLFLSFVGSFIKPLERLDKGTREYSGNCGKTYPIDYIIYTNLFCEIKTND